MLIQNKRYERKRDKEKERQAEKGREEDEETDIVMKSNNINEKQRKIEERRTKMVRSKKSRRTQSIL